MITRTHYLNRIIDLNGTPDIKIITGIRRSGKSKLMQAYIAYLKAHVPNANIIFIDFMDLAYEELKEYHALYRFVEAHNQVGKVNYLFVDEVQLCPDFELAINSLYAKGSYDIYNRLQCISVKCGSGNPVHGSLYRDPCFPVQFWGILPILQRNAGS